MTTITIELPDEQAIEFRKLAEEIGVTPEQLLQAGIEEWLRAPRKEFTNAAAYVLKKNAEL